MANEHQEHEKKFELKIDRDVFHVTVDHMTGAQLRELPSQPIEADRDLFEVVPGGTDRKIENETIVELHSGMRLFTAPAHINPGRR
jgi:hypothetical protein